MQSYNRLIILLRLSWGLATNVGTFASASDIEAIERHPSISILNAGDRHHGPCGEYDLKGKPFPWHSNVPLIVSVGGDGNCTSIQAAIDLLTWGEAAYRPRFEIIVRPGVYREKLRVVPPTPPLTLRGLGQSAEDVLVVWDDAEYSPDGPADCRGNQHGEWDSQTLLVSADDFIASDMTFWNSACQNLKGRNFAVSVTGDRVAFFHVRMLGTQDTFYTGFHRVYVRDSWINGTGDFLFGIGSAVFEDCEIRSEVAGHITAQKGNNKSQVDGLESGCVWGIGKSCEVYLFLGGWLTRAATVKDGSCYLGRPWHGDWATVVLKNVWMDAHISPKGWSPWSTGCSDDTAVCNNIFYAEANSTGPGAKPWGRVKWSRQLDTSEAHVYTTTSVLRGWMPLDPRNTITFNSMRSRVFV